MAVQTDNPSNTTLTPSTNIDASNTDTFDIVSTYQNLLTEDPDLTMPIAAIEALVKVLSQMPTSTVTETLMLLSRYSDILKSSIPNPISLSAGTDLFQRYLVTSLQRSSSDVSNLQSRTTVTPPTTSSSSSSTTTSLDDDFHLIRRHLLTNGRLFVSRAQEARQKIATYARHFVRDGSTVLTFGGSRVVGAVLQAAAQESNSGSVRFRVIYVLGAAAFHEDSNENKEKKKSNDGSENNGYDSADATKHEGLSIVRNLRDRGVPVATIPESAVGYALGKVDMVMVGAEGVVENGGIISRLGTYQLGMLAKATGKPFYVMAESHKFVRLYPVGQYDMPIEQNVVKFRVDGEGDGGRDGEKEKGQQRDPSNGIDTGQLPSKIGHEGRLAVRANNLCDAVDFTPPKLISGIITESGVLTPSAVSEELIKMWF